MASSWPLALLGNPVAGDWANPPFCIVAERVEVTVGPTLSIVSGRYMFEYVEKDDVEQLPRLFIHYPLYVEKGLRDWRDIVDATEIKLQIGDQSFRPEWAGAIRRDFLSDYPMPDDADVAFVTFRIPRAVAKLRFEARISHVQPNFHYRGVLLAAYTPWLPKFSQFKNAYGLDDLDFEVDLKAAPGITLQRFPTDEKLRKESPEEFIVFPEHRKTIAVEVRPNKSPEATPGTRPPTPPSPSSGAPRL